MDNSDKEILKDYLPEEKPEKDEKHSENEKTKETCQEKELTSDIPVDWQVKRKSESRFESRRKRSTDIVLKESDNLTNCANGQDTEMSATNSTKYETQSPVTLPYNRNESLEEHPNQSDQSTTQGKDIKSSEESNCAMQKIKVSITGYFSNAINQSESEQALDNIVCTVRNSIIHTLKELHEETVAKQQNLTGKPMSENIHTKCFEIHLSNKNHTKIDENLFKKGQVADNEPSKFLESEHFSEKCKQDKFKPIISPRKRKSEEIVDDETKRKRDTDNVAIEVRNEENLIDSSNPQDSELYAGYTKKRGNHLVNTVVSIDYTPKISVNKQDIPINQTDQSAIKYKVTTSKTDYESHEQQTSNNESTPDQIQSSDEELLLEDSVDSSQDSFSISLDERKFYSSFLDNVKKDVITSTQNEIKNISTSEDKSRFSKKDILIQNLKHFRDFAKSHELKLPKKVENKSVKFPNNMSNTNTKVSCNIPLEMRKRPVDTGKSEAPNVSKSHEYAQSEEYLPRHGVIGDKKRNRNSGFSSVKLFSNSESSLNPIYNEPESEFLNLEKLENNPIFIEKQRLMHVDISLQRQKISSMKPKSDEKVKFPKPLEDKGPNKVVSEINNKVEFRICDLVRILANNLISEGTDIRHLDNSALISRFVGVAEVYDPDIIPSIYSNIIEDRERTRQLLEAIKIDYCLLATESPEKNNRALNPVESIYHQRQRISIKNPDSDDSGETLKNESPIEMGPEVPVCQRRILNLYRILSKDLKSEGKDIRFLDNSTRISRLIGVAEFHDPNAVPYILSRMHEHEERTRLSPEVMKIVFDILAKEILEQKRGALNPFAFADESPERYPHCETSSSSESEPDDKNSEADSAEIREYPGLTVDTPGVKKDARYPKKNYKQKAPLTLPQIKPDTEEKHIPSTSNAPQIVSKYTDDDIHEQFHVDSNILSNNKLLTKEEFEGTLSAEKPTKVKDLIHEKRLCRLKPVALPNKFSGDADFSGIEPKIDYDKNQIQRIDDGQRIVSRNSEYGVQEVSEKNPKILLKDYTFKETGKSDDKPSAGTSAITSEYKISSFLEESPNSSQSSFPIRNYESTLPSVLEIIPQLEVLGGHPISIASQVYSSEAEPPQCPSSEARPSSTNIDYK